MRNILYIVPSDFDSLKKKGVTDMIKERDEGGFFDKVITLHPFTRNNKEINLSDNNKIIEYGWRTGIDFLDKFFITKILGTMRILFKLAFIFPFVIKKEKIDIIRATDPYYMGLLGLYYSKIFKIPFVVSVHSDYDLGDKLGGQTFKIFGSRRLAKKLEKFIYKNSSKIFPISVYLKEKIINEHKIDQSKIEIFYHGISFKKFDETKYISIREKFNIKSKYIIGYVARLSKEKKCLDVLYICKKLTEYRKDFMFLVAGNGSEYKYMKEYIKKYNLENYIMLIGFQNKNIIYNMRKQSFINLCLLDGFSLIEACAGARPIIAYDIEWHYELVKNNETGFLVNVGDIDAVVEKINFLMNNPYIADKLGENARKLAFKRHNIDNIIKIRQNLYKKLIESDC